MSPQTGKYKAKSKDSAVLEPEAVFTIEECLKKNLQSLFLSETLTVQAYHHFMKASHCEDLQDLFFDCQQSSKTRLQRVSNILGRMGEVEEPHGFCATTKALVQRAENICAQPEGALRDIQIINCALEIENALIQKYRISAEFCETLGQYKMGALLDTSMSEIENTWKTLNELLVSWLEKVHDLEERVYLSGNLPLVD